MSDRFEQQYPLKAREKEIKQILQYVTHGQSCQLISVPGAGRSTVLRLLTYNKRLLTRHLKNNNYLFVYVNFAEIASFETSELYKFLFLSMLNSVEGQLRHSGERSASRIDSGQARMTHNKEFQHLYNDLYNIFEKSLKLNDPLVMFQNLKKTILTIGQATIFLFDRFSEFADKTTGDFFTSLKSLRTATGGKLAVVFSTHRPLEDLLSVDHWKDFYEFFVSNHIFLELYDKEATGFRMAVLEKEYGKKLAPKVKDEIIKLTGGHGKLVKLTAQLLLSSHPERSADWRRVEGSSNIIDFLLSHILIRGSLLEIWQSLTSQEKEALKEYIFNNAAMQQLNNTLLPSFHLPFPLLTEFIKRNIADELIPKTIRFSGKQNEIYFGDQPLSDLTNYEFRLLKYLIDNPNRVCDREEIINSVWTDSKTQQGVSNQALDQMVHRLRKKIEDEADNPKHLLTVKGRGFRFLP